MESRKHTLEKVARAMGSRHDDGLMHTGMLLAYVQAVYGTIRKMATPTPLYRLDYDEENNSLALRESGGASDVPGERSMDINDLDIVLMGNLRDIPILFEGESGVGKTYISQAFLQTVFPQGSYVALRLSGSTFLNNVFQPFLEGRIEQGMPVTRIRQSAVDGMAAMLVDEINRGDPQNILQLLDNELYNSGVFVRLGLRIPVVENGGKVRLGEGRKKLAILSAQNPAVTADAKFTGTVELDAAVDNRLLKIAFGNAAHSVGSGIWLTEEVHRPFDQFIASFARLASAHLGVAAGAFDALAEDWLSVYAWITDASRTDKPILYSSLELTDLLVSALGGDLCGKHRAEARIANEWARRLGQDIGVPEDAPETEEVKRIHEIVETFRVPLIFRDIVQIRKLADVLATLGNLREALRSADPAKAYTSMERFVTIREIAGAAALLARSKQLPGSAPATPIVNGILVQYVSLAEAYLRDIGYLRASFGRSDPNLGIRKLAIVKAIRETPARSRGAAAALVLRLGEEVRRLLAHSRGTDEVRALIVAKLAADILTFAGFVADNAPDVEALLQRRTKTSDAQEVIQRLADLYAARRDGGAATLGDIFQHRIGRTLGA